MCMPSPWEIVLIEDSLKNLWIKTQELLLLLWSTRISRAQIWCQARNGSTENYPFARTRSTCAICSCWIRLMSPRELYSLKNYSLLEANLILWICYRIINLADRYLGHNVGDSNSVRIRFQIHTKFDAKTWRVQRRRVVADGRVFRLVLLDDINNSNFIPVLLATLLNIHLHSFALFSASLASLLG